MVSGVIVVPNIAIPLFQQVNNSILINIIIINNKLWH